VFVLESNVNVVSERTTAGAIIDRRTVTQQPLSIDLLPDGGQLIVCRNNIYEFDKGGKPVWTHPRNNYDVMAGRRLPNGETVIVTNAYQNPNGQRVPNCFRIDAKGQDAKKNLTFNWIKQLQTMDVVGEDHLLLCECENKPEGQLDRVAEYDLKTGKQTWKYDCPPNSGPTCCQRLPNGNTLITLLNVGQGGHVIEVDPSGEIVWDYQAKDGLRAARAYRR
jgi:hypothetical protein